MCALGVVRGRYSCSDAFLCASSAPCEAVFYHESEDCLPALQAGDLVVLVNVALAPARYSWRFGDDAKVCCTQIYPSDAAFGATVRVQRRGPDGRFAPAFTFPRATSVSAGVSTAVDRLFLSRRMKVVWAARLPLESLSHGWCARARGRCLCLWPNKFCTRPLSFSSSLLSRTRAIGLPSAQRARAPSTPRAGSARRAPWALCPARPRELGRGKNGRGRRFSGRTVCAIFVIHVLFPGATVRGAVNAAADGAHSVAAPR